MTETLADEYPEATPFIEDAVAEHGEEWVLEHYYTKLYPLAVVMNMPDKDELPFFDPDRHETMPGEELQEMYEAWGQYRENLRAGMASDS